MIAFIHDLTIQQIFFFNTGGLSFGIPIVIFLFILQLPILSLYSYFAKRNFIAIAMTTNLLIALISLICLYLKLDRIFIIISVKTGFLSFLFSLLYLFTTRENVFNVKMFVLFALGYSIFVVTMLMVPYSMDVFQVSWLYFLD